MTRSKISMAWVVLSAALFPVVLEAQGLKVGVVDMEQAIVQSVEGKKAETAFTAKLESLRKGIEAKQQQLDTIQNKLKTQDRLLAEDVKAGLTRDIDRLQIEIARDQEDGQKELDTLRGDLMRPIAEVAEKVVNDYAKEEGYTLIIDLSNPDNTSVVWRHPSADVTQEIIKRIDAEMARNPPKKPNP
jgi:Skp family chaperone for outer membrane proteins